MSDTQEAVNQVATKRASGGARSRKLWWLLPLAVLLLLVGIIYLLGHMGSADSEMYPTTERQSAADTRFC